jgi:hypothetical protein
MNSERTSIKIKTVISICAILSFISYKNLGILVHIASGLKILSHTELKKGYTIQKSARKKGITI